MIAATLDDGGAELRGVLATVIGHRAEKGRILTDGGRTATSRDRSTAVTQDPLFAFGEGLSYTTVEYSNLRLDSDQVTPDGIIHARITLTNTGSRPALETVQAYIMDTITSVTWAERELKAFTQAAIDPGESADVEIAIPASECSIVDAEGRRIVEPGDFQLLVGSSSRDPRMLSSRFGITGQPT